MKKRIWRDNDDKPKRPQPSDFNRWNRVIPMNDFMIYSRVDFDKIFLDPEANGNPNRVNSNRGNRRSEMDRRRN